MWASGFLVGNIKFIPKVKSFLFLKAVFGGQRGGLLFSVATHTSFLALVCLLFLQAVFGGQCGGILLQKFFGLDTVKAFFK